MPKTTKYEITYWNDLASHRFGGKCLSKKASRTTDPLRWECADGHVFRSRPANVLDGHWCPVCGRIAAAQTRHKNAVDRVTEIIRKKKGRLFTPLDSVSNMNSVIEVSCPKGHTWETRPAIIQSGSWCPSCASEYRARRRTTSMKDLQALAAAKGGKILKPIAGNGMRGVYLVKCSVPEHSAWKIRGWAMRRNWCPECNRPGRATGKKSAPRS
jgi:hypothetical protein